MNDNIIVKEWFRYAGNDLIVAKRCVDDFYPKQTEIAAFHSQQCAEKALKAYLIYNDIDPPKTHDLTILCEMCQDIDASFVKIKGWCDPLTPFGVSVRYPDEIAPDETIAKSAVDKAQQIYDFCRGKAGV
jgi:HEPN domain-containing protein